ncbi:RusA family crossover junction endodeoxyribonuclease [Intestinibacillus massiliensis]|uniref:RusA family crossover junction endodeoxyribonuclease n=1 Tax=Intestinibacillus massiliensis TaxID=1871029 RepID=UPI000B3600BF|nr:RusA family crossover junction endodeoxyribonuclease [Intestinibacillus massiliensis]
MTKFTIRGTLPGLNDYITAERTNRYKGAEMKRRCEAVAMHAAQQLGGVCFTRPVRFVYRWFEPNRHRDKDNISAFGRKVIQDALVRAKVLENDGWKQIEGFEDQFFVDKKAPRIEVQIFEVDE